MATQLVLENLNGAGARLPAAYEKACAALTSCASIDALFVHRRWMKPKPTHRCAPAFSPQG